MNDNKKEIKSTQLNSNEYYQNSENKKRTLHNRAIFGTLVRNYILLHLLLFFFDQQLLMLPYDLVRQKKTMIYVNYI